MTAVAVTGGESWAPLMLTVTGVRPVVTAVVHWSSLNRWKVIVPVASVVVPLRVAVSLIGLSMTAFATAFVLSDGCFLLTTVDSLVSPLAVDVDALLASPL